MANKYYLNPNKTGGQPVQELYDTVNYLSGMSADGTASTATIVNDTPVNYITDVTITDQGTLTVECPATFSGKTTLAGENQITGSSTVYSGFTIAQGASLSANGNIVSSGNNTFSGQTEFTINPLKANGGLEVSGVSKFNSPVSFLSTTSLPGMTFEKGDATNKCIASAEISAPSISVSGTLKANRIEGQSITATNAITAGNLKITASDGGLSTSGNIQASKVFGSVFNDYAELFPKGGSTEPGDIVALDVDADTEVYRRAISGDRLLVGVHSAQYSHLIGGEKVPADVDFLEYNLKKYIPIGLAGRVRVKVLAPIRKGDKITISAVPGVGKCAEYGDQVIGYALEDYDDDLNIGTVNMKII